MRGVGKGKNGEREEKRGGSRRDRDIGLREEESLEESENKW